MRERERERESARQEGTRERTLELIPPPPALTKIARATRATPSSGRAGGGKNGRVKGASPMRGGWAAS